MEYNQNSIKVFFRNFCDSILDNENKLIIQRAKLQSLYCFSDSYGYFKYLDKNQKNYIDNSDLSLFISLYKIKCTKSQLNHILKKYDKDSDSCWNFSEYSNFIEDGVNTYFNKSNNFVETESKIENYEKELIKLFELEINYLKYIGIKIKALKELINSKNINTKNIFNIILNNQSQNKKDIDSNALISFLNDGNYYIKKENAYKIIQLISGGKNTFNEKNLDNMFKYDKYINNSELKYPHFKKNVENEILLPHSLKKYEGEFPMNNCGVLYFNIHKSDEDDKYQKIKDIQIKNEYINHKNDNFLINNQNNLNNSDNYNKKFYNANQEFMNISNKEENILLNSGNSVPLQNELHTLSSFSFK